MPRRGDATIRNARHTKLAGNAGHVVDSSGLGTAHSTHLLGSADGAAAHAHAETVHACQDEVIGLSGGHHVAADELDVRVGGLDVLDHVDLVHRITLGRIDHDDVRARRDQCLHTQLVVGASANRRTHQ